MNESSLLLQSVGTDAQKWARAFVAAVRESPSIATDEGTLIGWFANAIECGGDRERWKLEARVRELETKLRELEPGDRCQHCGRKVDLFKGCPYCSDVKIYPSPAGKEKSEK